MSPPMAFIFEWNSTASTPSPRSTRLAPALRRTGGRSALAARRIRSSGPRACRTASRSRIASGGSDNPHDSSTTSGPIASHSSNGPSSQPNPHRMARSTSAGGVGNGGSGLRRVNECPAQRRARERTGAAAVPQQRADSRGQVVNGAGGIHRRQLRRLPRPVGERRRVERQDLAALRRALLPVEALACLLADPAPFDQRVNQRREPERVPLRLTLESPAQIARHVRQDVQAGNVHRAEGGALRAADKRSAQRVDLLDGELPVGQQFQGARRAVHPDAVGNEPGRISGDHHTLAEREVAEAGDAVHHLRAGVGGRNDFEQREVARRVEEMRAEPVPAECRRAALRDVGNRDARRIRADDGVGAAVWLHPRQQRLLDV